MRLLVVLAGLGVALGAPDKSYCVGKPDGNYMDPEFPCSTFYIRCWEGQTIPKRCLIPGHRFDEDFGKCRPKEDVAICRPSTPVPAPPTTPAVFSCKFRPNGHYKVPGSGCTNEFVLCWEGQTIPSVCRPSSWRVKGVDGQSGARCVPASEVSECQPPPTPAAPVDVLFTCAGRQNGDYKIPGSGCTGKFARCWEGQLFETSCQPPEWRFDGEDGLLGRCLPAKFAAACKPPTTPVPAPPSTTTKPPGFCTFRPNGNYKLPGSGCTNEFVRCWEGETIPSTCQPSSYRVLGQDGGLAECVPAFKVLECRPTTTTTPAPAPPSTRPPFSCKFRKNGSYKIPGSGCTNKFARCWEGELIEAECIPSNYRFLGEDGQLGTCVPEALVLECRPPAPPIVPPPPPKGKFSCVSQPNGNYPVPGEVCTQSYIRCWEGERFESFCGRDERFDSQLRICKPQEFVFECINKGFDCSNLPDGSYPDPKEPCSTHFWMCSSGEAFRQECAGAAYFDEDAMECLGKAYVKACGGTPTVKAEPVTKPPQPLPNIPFDCTGLEDGFYSNPQEECSSYFMGCIGETKQVMRCAEDLKFDAISRRCIEKQYNKWCGGTPTTTTEAPLPRPRVLEFDCTDLPDGYYPKVEKESYGYGRVSTCSEEYWGCHGGVVEPMVCASGLKFDEIEKMCLSPLHVKACGGTPTPRPSTTVGPLPDPSVIPDASCQGKADGDYADEWRPCEHHYYFSCVDGQLTIRQCAMENLRYDETIGECQEELYIKKCGGTPTTRAPPDVPIVTPPDVDCSNQPDGIFFPNPKQPCSKDYYTCNGGVPMELWCPAKLYYDVESNMCLHKLYIKACGGTPTPRPEPPVPAPPEPVFPVKPEFDCFGRPSGLFEDPENPCSPVYYKCFLGKATKLVCPRPQVNRFDVLSGTCLPKASVAWCKFSFPIRK